MTMARDLAEALEVARRAADAGGRAALAYFQKGVQAEKKPDDSPVTAADRAAEAAILEIIRARYPDDDILAEESGAIAGRPSGSERQRWIIDPLDGTKSFLRGLPFWGPLIALETNGLPVVGAVGLPVLGESFAAARGLGCFDHQNRRLSVSQTASLAEATLSLGELKHLLAPPHGARVTELIRTARNARCVGDAAGPIMMLRGQADVWLEAGVKLWDLAAHQVLIEEAGGVFTDLAGVRTAASGHCLAAIPQLHPLVLERLRP
jgi:histidinol-phosphatase